MQVFSPAPRSGGEGRGREGASGRGKRESRFLDFHSNLYLTSVLVGESNHHFGDNFFPRVGQTGTAGERHEYSVSNRSMAAICAPLQPRLFYIFSSWKTFRGCKKNSAHIVILFGRTIF